MWGARRGQASQLMDPFQGWTTSVLPVQAQGRHGTRDVTCAPQQLRAGQGPVDSHSVSRAWDMSGARD